jgi:hypothetical protein
MDKPRRLPDESPGLSGPDYFSVVIEWEKEPEQQAAAPSGELEDQITDRQIRHWDVVDEASAESFPASDPPAWGSSHAAPTPHSAAAMSGAVQAHQPSWVRRHVRGVAVGCAALATTLVASMYLRRHHHAA